MRRLLRLLFRTALARTAGRKGYQLFYETLHEVALHGMNYRSGDFRTSGELKTMHEIASRKAGQGEVVLFDVGANIGEYTTELAGAFSASGSRPTIHAFEPSLAAFRTLCEVAAANSCVLPRQFALGERAEPGELHYDHPGSSLGSIYLRDLGDYGVHLTQSEQIELTTLDTYCSDAGVAHIDFLKIDTEGNELAVLRGAQCMIAAGKIDFIQFEFGESAIDARHYLRDFFRILPGYQISRITRDGLRALGRYKEEYEIFRTVNFLAERTEVDSE
jgi:FkbM family methyltransferase